MSTGFTPDPPRRPHRMGSLIAATAAAAAITMALGHFVHTTAAATFLGVFVATTATLLVCQRGERRRARAVWIAAHRDPLTGLPTRAVVERALDAATTAGIVITVALADADDLNVVNDVAGHAAGDAYLRGVAVRLAAATPPGALLARLGGDEFVILAPDIGPNELAAAITAGLAEPGVPIGELLPQASVGVAAGSGDARYTLAQADAALHTAKRSGHPVLIYAPERDGTPNPDGSRPPLRRRDQRTGTDPLAWTPGTATAQARLVCSLADLATILRAVRTAHDWWALVLEATSTGTGMEPPTPTAQTARQHMIQYADLAARIAPILHLDRQ